MTTCKSPECYFPLKKKPTLCTPSLLSNIEFKTGALTSLRIPKIVEYYSDVESVMVLKCIRVGNACDWKDYEVACGYYEKHKEAFKF